jgi:Tfp pilus assembly protein PilE
VNLVDSDGNSPQVVGAVVGAGLDIVTQVGENLIRGDKWYKIDVKSVIISAGAGAVGAGIVSKVKRVKALADLGKTAVAAGEALTEAAVSGAESIVKQYASEESVSLKETLTDAAIGGVSSLTGFAAKAGKQASSRGRQELKTLENQLDRAERVAGGNNSRASRQTTVERTKNKIETYGDARKTAVSAASDFTISTFEDNKHYNEGRRNE